MTVQPLRRVLTLQSLMAIILPFAVVMIVGLLWAVPHIKTDAGERQIQLARIVGMQVESHLETGAAIVRAAAAMPRGDQNHFASLLDSTDTMSSMYEILPDGTVSLVALHRNHLAQQRDQIGLNLSRNPLFREVVQNKKPCWSETFLSVISGGLVVAYGVPGIGTTLIGEVDLTLLTTFLKQISTENDLLILILDHNGQVVADNNGRFTAQQLNIGNIPLVRDGIKSDNSTTGQFELSGIAMTGSIVQIKSVNWHALVAKSNVSLYRTPLYITLFVLAGILVAVCCGLMTSVYLARKLAGRFDDLTRHAQNIAHGNSLGEWPTSTIFEFNQLSDNLQVMARSQEENRRFLADMIEYSGILIAVKNIAGQYEIVNRKWEEVTGLLRQNVIGKSDEELFPGPVGHQLRENDMEVIESGRYIEKEEMIDDEVLGLRYGISTKFPLKFQDGSVRGVCVMSTDITDRKRAEEENMKLEQQLLHAQKLESLGVLAGGIAHDFNNILMAIMGNADLALMRLSKESPAVDNLHRIEQAAARAADLAKQMLAYSGKGKFVVEQIDLNRLLEEMLHMLEVSISKKAVLRLNPYKPLPSVEADATQMRQIIMNLVINASEAIGDKSGIIAITTGCMDCDRSYLKDVWLDENLTDGLYVYLEIADTGCGMDKETLSKLFDPFFTTKFTGRGLGMAAVLGIVRGHKGAIKVYSEANKGTTFKILLPACDRPAELFNGASHIDDWKGTGTVLLVDDEETVRGIGTEMLKELGFAVITANDGCEAVEVFKLRNDITLVILDLTMPHMDGEQCFRELRQLNGNVKVIMSSGYNEQEVTQKFVGKGLAGFIQKPYKLSTLQEVIQNVE